MRRSLLLAVLGIAAMLMMPGLARAQVTGDSAVGTVTVFQDPAIGDALLELNAHSGPSGENPTGRFVLRFPQFPTPIEGSVACLRVSGNTAVVGVNFINAGAPAASIQVVDAPVDMLNLRIESALLGPGSCPATISENPLTVTSGDIVVTDAQPLPTSAEQCKRGGWRNFPDFKNQGDCVSFVATGGVATGGRNQPAGSG